MKLVHKSDSWVLEEREREFLFSYFLRFCCKTGLYSFDRSSIIISDQNLNTFRIFVRNALIDLIQDCYSDPEIKERQKHFLHYEKIYFEGKKLVVNYTTSPLGRLIYTIYLRLVFIDKVISQNGELVIEEINQK